MSFDFPYSPRLWERIDRRIQRQGAEGCWLWAGLKNPNGYGYISYQVDKVRKHLTVHRLIAARDRGAPVPAGLVVMHQCDVRLCCNPAHLSIGTQAENLRDCASKGRHSAQRQTHCRHGHPFNAANTHFSETGLRTCRVCNRTRHRERYHANKKGEHDER